MWTLSQCEEQHDQESRGSVSGNCNASRVHLLAYECASHRTHIHVLILLVCLFVLFSEIQKELSAPF